MGGPATFSGTSYQSRVIALVYCHMIAEAPLGWFGGVDVPTSLVPETGGVGDDFLIDCGAAGPRFESQAKHGLTGRQDIIEMVKRLAAAGKHEHLVLVVDSSSSNTIRNDFRGDLDRLRSGRESPLSDFTKRIRDAVPSEFAAVRQLRIVQVDVDTSADAGTGLALAVLRNALEDPTQAEAAFDILVADAAEACARRLHRTRASLVTALQSKGIAVKPRQPNDRWHARLDMTKRLLDGFRTDGAIAELDQLSSEIATGPAEPRVRYRLAVQRSVAFRQFEQSDRALRHAREALDIDPDGVEALLNACYASLGLGDREGAREFATQAQRVAPTDRRPWIADLWAGRGAARPGVAPPAIVAEDPEYRTALAQVANADQRFQEAAALAAQVMQQGVQTPAVLIVRAEAAFSQTSLPPNQADRAVLEDAERWLSDALNKLNNDEHPSTRVALAFRAEVRHRLGKGPEAEEDVRSLQALDPDDPNALIRIARMLAIRGDTEDAFAMLRRPVVDNHAELLAVRSSLALQLGKRSQALEDLDAAERRLADAFDADAARAQLADVASELDEPARAERLLNGITSSAQAAVRTRLAWARLRWCQGDRQEAARICQDTADAHPEARQDVLLELAHRHLHEQEFAEAVAVFDKIGEERLSETTLPAFARALVGNGLLVRVQRLIEALSAEGSLPEWAIRVAADLAGRQEDTETQVALLEELLRRGSDELRVRYALVGHLLELGRNADAERHLEAVLSLPDLSPPERMQGALFLKELGYVDRAVDVAFAAYREQPNEAQIARAFISITFLSSAAPREVTEVGADTYVELARNDGATEAYSIYAAPPVDAQRGECPVSDAEALGLLGKKIGDRIERNNAGWREEWTVTVLQPVELHAAQDAASGYARRFPREPFFITSLPVGDEGSVRDLAPMIASLEGRRRLFETAYGLYLENGLPLGALAKLLSVPIPAVMVRSNLPPLNIPLLVEWADTKEQEAVRQMLGESTTLIVSRSALQSSASLGLLTALTPTYRLVAPRTLRTELEKELREARRELENGRRSVAAGPTGLTAEEVPAGHPALRRVVELLEAQRDWLLTNVSLEARPLEIVARDAAQGSQMRELIGEADYDAAMLAIHMEAVLYVDDLALRRLDVGSQRLRSCSTVTLLPALAQRGVIAAEERDAMLTRIVMLRYATVIPTPELMLHSIRQVPTAGRDGMQAVMGTLGSSFTELGSAVDIFVDTLKRCAALDIQVVSIRELTTLGLIAMASSWPRSVVIDAVLRAASRTLRLLPRALQECLDGCQSFRAQGEAGGNEGLWRP